jgi:hypothetical protein
MLTIERQQRIKEELYLYLLNKREESQLSQATTESDARVIDPAVPDVQKISPSKRIMLSAGVFEGWLCYRHPAVYHVLRYPHQRPQGHRRFDYLPFMARFRTTRCGASRT